MQMERSVLREAEGLVYGNRGQDYGHPSVDFTRTGKMWGAILGIESVPDWKVALCMVALKISRECNMHKRDNLTDAAGYVETCRMCRENMAAFIPPQEDI